MKEIMFHIQWIATDGSKQSTIRPMTVFTHDIEWVTRQFSEANNNGYCEAHCGGKILFTYGTKP